MFLIGWKKGESGRQRQEKRVSMVRSDALPNGSVCCRSGAWLAARFGMREGSKGAPLVTNSFNSQLPPSAPILHSFHVGRYTDHS